MRKRGRLNDEEPPHKTNFGRRKKPVFDDVLASSDDESPELNGKDSSGNRVRTGSAVEINAPVLSVPHAETPRNEPNLNSDDKPQWSASISRAIEFLRLLNCKREAASPSYFCQTHRGGEQASGHQIGQQVGQQVESDYCGHKDKDTLVVCRAPTTPSWRLCHKHGGPKRCTHIYETTDLRCPSPYFGTIRMCFLHRGSGFCQAENQRSGLPCIGRAEKGSDFCAEHGGGKRCTFVNFTTGLACPLRAEQAAGFCKTHNGAESKSNAASDERDARSSLPLPNLAPPSQSLPLPSISVESFISSFFSSTSKNMEVSRLSLPKPLDATAKTPLSTAVARLASTPTRILQNPITYPGHCKANYDAWPLIAPQASSATTVPRTRESTAPSMRSNNHDVRPMTSQHARCVTVAGRTGVSSAVPTDSHSHEYYPNAADWTLTRASPVNRLRWQGIWDSVPPTAAAAKKRAFFSSTGIQ